MLDTKEAKRIVRQEIESAFSPEVIGSGKSTLENIRLAVDRHTIPGSVLSPDKAFDITDFLMAQGELPSNIIFLESMLNKIYGTQEVSRWNSQKITQTYTELVGNELAEMIIGQSKEIQTPQKETAPRSLIVNLFAGPGAGKTTCAMEIAAELKKHNIQTEYVSEYAKELVYAKDYETLKNQSAVTGEQFRRLQLANGQVDVIVTDSPILLGLVYDQSQSKDFASKIIAQHNSMENFNLFIKRGTSYQTEGRLHTQDEAIQIDNRILKLLKDNKLFFGTYNHKTVDVVVQNIITRLKNLNDEKQKGAVSEMPQISKTEAKDQWKQVTLPQSCLVSRYEKSSLFKMPENTEFAGNVFYMPNALYKEGTTIVDFQSEAKEKCYRISFTDSSVFKLKSKDGKEQTITAERFLHALDDNMMKAYSAKENAPQLPKYNNTRQYETNTPKTLQQRKQFVCMELTWDATKGKFSKMLVNPVTSGNAQVDNSATWSDFQTACAAAQKGSIKGRNVDGIGYILTSSDNIIGIDLDLDKETKQLTAQGKAILSKLEGKTYIEHSASGAIHIFGYGEKPGERSKGKEDNTLEIYGSKGGNRCLMLTGKLYQGKMFELNNIQTEVDEIYKQHFYVEPVQRKAHQSSPTLSEQEVLNKIQESKSADKFNSLMAGDISGHGNDYNRADLALCSIVAFFTQDRNVIDGIYRQSRLYSADKINEQTRRTESRAEKWDKSRTGGTYGEQTIDLAIKNVLNTYTKKTPEHKDVEPMRIYQSTEKAVLIKIDDETAKGGKRFEWLPKSLIKTDKEGKTVTAAESALIADKKLPLKKNLIATKKNN